MKKMFIRNLPQNASEQSVRELFSRHGTVRSIRISTDIFTGKCRGTGLIEMEGHEARAAISALNGFSLEGNQLRVNFEEENLRFKKKGR